MAITVSMNGMNVADSGRFGKAVEMAMTEKSYVKASGKCDWTHLRERFEIKTGAGELKITRTGKIAHCKKILYIPVPVESASETLNPFEQEGFILDADDFLEILQDVGLFRESKKKTDGSYTAAIQTFWNRKKNAPHGKGYERLLDALYDRCEETLEDFLERTYGEG